MEQKSTASCPEVDLDGISCIGHGISYRAAGKFSKIWNFEQANHSLGQHHSPAVTQSPMNLVDEVKLRRLGISITEL